MEGEFIHRAGIRSQGQLQSDKMVGVQDLLIQSMPDYVQNVYTAIIWSRMRSSEQLILLKFVLKF